MKIVYEYSHLGGSEILCLRYPDYEREIYEIIAGVKAQKSKVSKEKTMRGRKLYSPRDMNREFRKAFTARGYTELRDTYTITVPNSNVSIPGAFKQIDFVKGKVLVEVQFGKYAFMFYDMAKFQYFFNENKADVGVEIVPCHALHKEMSTGVSYGEQLVYDIERLKRHFPAVPVKIILIDADDGG
ncbi:restriction endonuclease BglII [Thermodesulfitimonas autotrophica]|uniref:Restriction endonuclease BglII n=1 Tax=Thermodesulfitimonas autotrophica TaxID=1894989 RepID=A0A3N5AP80_9THEO|nr:BglII/BstYI family type II restriction endonuclease [Thermodesulfitimonas autotrophica]RPF46763.1 restriction endonuclease BglII [Thermodesulfitimonas autotrophica]